MVSTQAFGQTEAGFKATTQLGANEFAQNLKLERDRLQESIREFEAQYARDAENLRFLLRKEQVAVEEGNRSALQNAIALREQIASRVESNRLQRTTLEQNVRTLNAQMAQEAAQFNAQQALQADQINEARRQANLEQRRGVARDIAEFSANPGDIGKQLAYLRAGGAAPITEALAGGEVGYTDESLLPLQLLLGTRNELNEGPGFVEAERITAPVIGLPQFEEFEEIPDVSELWDPIEFDDSGIVGAELGAPPDVYGEVEPVNVVYGPSSTQVEDAAGNTYSVPAAAGAVATSEEITSLPFGGQIVGGNGQTYTNYGYADGALSRLSPSGDSDNVHDIPKWVDEGLEKLPGAPPMGFDADVEPLKQFAKEKGWNIDPSLTDEQLAGFAQELGLAEGGVGFFSKPSKVNVAERGPEMVIGVPLAKQSGPAGRPSVGGRGMDSNGRIQAIPSGIAGETREERRLGLERKPFDLNAPPEPRTQPGDLSRLAVEPEVPAWASLTPAQQERLLALRKHRAAQLGGGSPAWQPQSFRSGGAIEFTPIGRAGSDELLPLPKAEFQRRVLPQLRPDLRWLRSRKAFEADPYGGFGSLEALQRAAAAEASGQPTMSQGFATHALEQYRAAQAQRGRPNARGVRPRGGAPARGRGRRAAPVGNGGGGARLAVEPTRAELEAMRPRGGGRRRARSGGLGMAQGGVGFFNQPTSVNVAETGPEAVLRVSGDEALAFQRQVYEDALRKSGFSSAPTPVGLSAPGTSQFVQQAGAGLAGLRGFSPDLYFEELQKARPTGIRSGVARRSG
jgi:hypothetical protein